MKKINTKAMFEQEYFSSEGHIEYLLRQIKASRLSVPAGFFNTDKKDLQECYNGIGPDRWSCCFRKLTTEILACFEAEALIHDWEYTYAPKTWMCFLKANLRFLFNGIKYAVFCYGFSKKTVNQCKLSIILAFLCQLFGWGGYKKTKAVK
ncbi:MAG: hypothetical protein J6W00_10855 [Lentisphaeria bacterium]|nr:hypothetical protein [Lentisphaeria bacterium]